jgi:hypothetical protein
MKSRRWLVVVTMGLGILGCSGDGGQACEFTPEGSVVSARVAISDSRATVDYELEGGGGGTDGTLSAIESPGSVLFTNDVAIAVLDSSVETNATQVCELNSDYTAHLLILPEVPTGRVEIGEIDGSPVFVDLLEIFDLQQGAGFFPARQ